MSLIAPPRQPHLDDPVDRDELEALIEEARRRARRRRRIYGVLAVGAALAGVAVFTVIDRAASTQSAPTASGTRISLSAAATNSQIVFVRDPDGDGLFCDDMELYVMNPDGSGQTRLARKARCDAPAWSPDARKVAFVRQRLGARLPRGGRAIHHDVYAVNADGSGERRLTSGPRGGDWFPAWSPDGQRIAFIRGSVGARTRDIYVMNADGSGQRQVTSGPRPDWGIVWSPDGRKIAFTSDSVYVINADGSGQRRLTSGLRARWGAVWSPDGRKLAFTSDYSDIYVINEDGSGQRKLTPGWFPVWSPDSRKIAFLRGGGVHVMNADGTGQRRLGASLSDVAPSWSPDGRQILFSRFVGPAHTRDQSGDAEGNTEIFVANVDGSGSRNLTRNPGDDISAAWSVTRGP